VKNITSKPGQLRLDKERRDFVKKSTLLGVGVAASAVLPTVAIANASEEKELPSKAKGYQLTPHIIEYYKSAAS